MSGAGRLGGGDEDWARAARAIAQADAFVFTAGAGMGVDSGLPDFRGDRGFWRAYPPYERLGLSFVQMANPAVFQRDPELAWGFYGHRLELYRETTPHAGFAILARWAERASRERLEAGAFVFTSNVDGQFQRAGFPEEEVVECHGSIHHLQCTRPCSDDIWPAPAGLRVDVDQDTMRARPPLPRCPRCGALARPNVLMFGDGRWVPDRTAAQEERLRDWLQERAGARLVIIECGAGTAVPTVRHTSESLARLPGATLIRVNPREPQLPRGLSGPHVSLPAGALAALGGLGRLVQE